MSKSHRSSHASARCRLEWRPSRWLAALLPMLGVLAAVGALGSGLPRGAAWLLAIAALMHALRLAARESDRAPVTVEWDGASGIVKVDGAAVDEAALHWRGPLAFLRWRAHDGCVRRLAWWPDTLPATLRRELRLAAGQAATAPRREPVAP